MGWRDYVVGELTGWVAVECDGRNPGDHDEITCATWHHDEKDGSARWSCYAGRPVSNEEKEPRADRNQHIGFLGTRSERARFSCPTCRLDVQVRFERLVPILDRLAAADMHHLPLRELARRLGRQQEPTGTLLARHEEAPVQYRG